ncbi:MAG: AIR synthase-related protein [Elusimicrobiota bacterium]|jgi:phosphoribosylformylglycinamidine synthase
MPHAVISHPAASAGMPLDGLTPKDLRNLSARHGWSLNESEMTAVQAHFRGLRRDPTRAELETLAQTWSEHCKHKTMTGPIRYSEGKKTRLIKNLLEETVFKATKQLKRPWCLSAFKDNAGIVSFGSKWALAYKVETNNRPCAIEPYGGAETGVGSVVRDVMGAGLGAKPILNTDVFCFAPPDYAGPLPETALHPRRVLDSVVSGVRDYGNRMGIPTAAGAIWFDPDYRLNPLVFCGTVGLLPAWAVSKTVKPGDIIVAAGGRTGRDGLHGATLSSIVPERPQTAPPHTGDAINEKKLLDALLEARQRKLYRAVTDCGAGGFSSAVGELAAKCGARVRLESARLKTPDLAPWEIWLSESQERMIFAVPPRNLKAFIAAFTAEDCETSILGEFTNDGRLKVAHNGAPVVDLDMRFLHGGLPAAEKRAVWEQPKPAPAKPSAHKKNLAQILVECLAHLNV